jgi:hypothetical protein
MWLQIAPLIYERDGVMEGALADILQCLAEESGINIVLHYLPPGRGALETIQGKVHINFTPAYFDPETGKNIPWSKGAYTYDVSFLDEPILTARTGSMAFARKDNMRPFVRSEKYQVGIIRSPIYDEAFFNQRFNYTSAKWVQAVRYSSLLKSLRLERIDYVAGPTVLIKHAEHEGFDLPLQVYHAAEPSPLLMLVGGVENIEGVADVLNHAIKRLRTKGVMADILNRHGILEYFVEP